MSTKIKTREKEEILYISFYEEEERKPCTLDWEVLADLDYCLSNINLLKTRILIIESLSPKSFIVGANIEVLKTLDAENIITWVKNGHSIFSKLQDLSIPVIAKIDSYALGGGLELAMACDFIIAGEKAKFAQPEASLGVMPGWGGTYRLAKLIGINRAKEMFFTGEIIDSDLAYKWGICNHVCKSEELDTYVENLAIKIISNDSKVLCYEKVLLNRYISKDIKENAFDEGITSSVCMNSDTTKKRLKEFFDKRKK